MERQHYLNTRNSGQIDINLAYEFYIETEHPTPKPPYQHFIQLFQMWLGTGIATMEKFYQHYDIKHNVTKLTFKNGDYKFI